MIDRPRRGATTRIVALALLGLLSAAPAGAVDLPGNARLRGLENAIARKLDDGAAAPQAPLQSFEEIGEGEASYYGTELAGNRTASGERFDPRALTCAHRTLPLGTLIRVTNLANGRSVIVRVNDRGPFVHSRILDVSLAAARDIGMVRAGKAMVRIEIVHNLA